MLCALALCLPLQTPVIPAATLETEVTAPYVSIDLFKNGEAVVTRELHIPSDGVYVLHEDLVHRHGTLRVDSAGSVRLLRTTRAQVVTENPAPGEPGIDLRTAMIGAVRSFTSSIATVRSRACCAASLMRSPGTSKVLHRASPTTKLSLTPSRPLTGSSVLAPLSTS